MPWIAALVLALAASLGGCDKKEKDRAPAPAPAAEPPAPPQGEITGAESLRRITGLADQICACPDRACADAANDAFQAENQKQAGRPRATPTPAEAEALQAQAKRLSGCVARLP